MTEVLKADSPNTDLLVARPGMEYNFGEQNPILVAARRHLEVRLPLPATAPRPNSTITAQDAAIALGGPYRKPTVQHLVEGKAVTDGNKKETKQATRERSVQAFGMFDEATGVGVVASSTAEHAYGKVTAAIAAETMGAFLGAYSDPHHKNYIADPKQRLAEAVDKTNEAVAITRAYALGYPDTTALAAAQEAQPDTTDPKEGYDARLHDSLSLSAFVIDGDRVYSAQVGGAKSVSTADVPTVGVPSDDRVKFDGFHKPHVFMADRPLDPGEHALVLTTNGIVADNEQLRALAASPNTTAAAQTIVERLRNKNTDAAALVVQLTTGDGREKPARRPAVPQVTPAPLPATVVAPPATATPKPAKRTKPQAAPDTAQVASIGTDSAGWPAFAEPTPPMRPGDARRLPLTTVAPDTAPAAPAASAATSPGVALEKLKTPQERIAELEALPYVPYLRWTEFAEKGVVENIFDSMRTADGSIDQNVLPAPGQDELQWIDERLHAVAIQGYTSTHTQLRAELDAHAYGPVTREYENILREIYPMTGNIPSALLADGSTVDATTLFNQANDYLQAIYEIRAERDRALASRPLPGGAPQSADLTSAAPTDPATAQTTTDLAPLPGTGDDAWTQTHTTPEPTPVGLTDPWKDTRPAWRKKLDLGRVSTAWYAAGARLTAGQLSRQERRELRRQRYEEDSGLKKNILRVVDGGSLLALGYFAYRFAMSVHGAAGHTPDFMDHPGAHTGALPEVTHSHTPTPTPSHSAAHHSASPSTHPSHSAKPSPTHSPKHSTVPTPEGTNDAQHGPAHYPASTPSHSTSPTPRATTTGEPSPQHGPAHYPASSSKPSPSPHTTATGEPSPQHGPAHYPAHSSQPTPKPSHSSAPSYHGNPDNDPHHQAPGTTHEQSGSTPATPANTVTVHSGDNLTRIATNLYEAKYHQQPTQGQVNAIIDNLAKSNHIADPNQIDAGQKLDTTSTNHFIDSLHQTASSHDVPPHHLQQPHNYHTIPSDTAHTQVHDGEGWSQWLADNGVTDPKQQQMLLNQNHDQLVASGVAYDQHGQLYMNMPSTGHVPQAIIDMLNNTLEADSEDE